MTDANSTCKGMTEITKDGEKGKTSVADKEFQTDTSDDKLNESFNSLSDHLRFACLDTRHKPQSDADSFEKLFEAWKKQDISAHVFEKNTKDETEFLKKKLTILEQKLKDRNESNELLQKAVDSLHNDLDLVHKVGEDNNSLKETVKQLQEKLAEMGNDLKRKSADYDEKIAKTESESKALINNITANMKKELEEKDTENKKQEELHKQEVDSFKAKLDMAVKARANEVAALTVEYEDKLVKFQRLKASSAQNQPQTSSHQEIFRKKLQQLRNEYESETKSLKDQVKTLQNQLASLKNAQQAISPVPAFAKRPRKF